MTTLNFCLAFKIGTGQVLMASKVAVIDCKAYFVEANKRETI